MKKYGLVFLVVLSMLTLHACDAVSELGNVKEAGIYGAEDITLTLGDAFDPYEGVSARDEDGNDITDALEVSGLDQLGMEKDKVYDVGEYVILYEAHEHSTARAITIEPSKEALHASCGNPEIGEYVITWCDEFTGEGDNLNAQGLDLDKWGVQTGTGTEYGLVGWGNDEAQYYREENARVEDGRLLIEAHLESFGGMDYTSARLRTEPTFSQTYGRFEAKIRLPEGVGLWPAFWMMPQDDVYGTWAASGEIDIMEAKGRLLNRSTGAIHYGGEWPDNTYTHGEYVFPDGRDITDFNVYAIEWEEGEIRWYVNDDLFFTATDWYTENQDFPAPFDQDFHLLLNLAIGGHFDGHKTPPDSLFNDPVLMEIEYVRVYQKD